MHLYEVIKRPVITEKTQYMASVQGQYTFEVDRRANKTQIRQAVETIYGVQVMAVNTMNMPALVDFLLASGLESPIVCSSINKAGYLMNPSRREVEETIRTKPFRPLAMSILSSGAVSPQEAIHYVTEQENIRAIVFGASSRAHIRETVELIAKADARASRDPSLSSA